LIPGVLFLLLHFAAGIALFFLAFMSLR
jgi:hypothetical protein